MTTFGFPARLQAERFADLLHAEGFDLPHPIQWHADQVRNFCETGQFEVRACPRHFVAGGGRASGVGRVKRIGRSEEVGGEVDSALGSCALAHGRGARSQRREPPMPRGLPLGAQLGIVPTGALLTPPTHNEYDEEAYGRLKEEMSAQMGDAEVDEARKRLDRLFNE